MAKISASRPRGVSGAYERLFGIPELGHLISKVQSAVSRSGNELEDMIINKVENVENLDKFLKNGSIPEGVCIAPKEMIKKSDILKTTGGEPDFLVFKGQNKKKQCFIVELKDGHSFDTKKSTVESAAMRSFVKRNAEHLPGEIRCYFCAFNNENKDEIIKGFKYRIKMGEVLTGREFCKLLNLRYEQIVQEREVDQEPNVKYFAQQLVKIGEVRKILVEALGKSDPK